MRMIKGRDLQTVLAEGPLEPARAIRIIEQIADALHAARSGATGQVAVDRLSPWPKHRVSQGRSRVPRQIR
jgi:hypothetical protein